VNARDICNLVVNGKPRDNHIDCYSEGECRPLFAVIEKLAGEPNVDVGDELKRQ